MVAAVCERCNWKQVADRAADLAMEWKWRNSAPFLLSVAHQAREKEHVTEAQAAKVQEIEDRGW